MEDKNEINTDQKLPKKELKEVQKTITPEANGNGNSKATEEEFFSTLKMVAPGTNLRTALDAALKTQHGALIVLENDHIQPLIDGGFRVNCRFTPQRLVELTKMDGAIIVSKDLKRIEHANVLLTPDSKIKTVETGTRHKAAERTAKQTGSLVIAISERKHEITLYYKNIRYSLKPSNEIFRKASEHIQMLEKQRDLFDSYVSRLTGLELRNHPSLHQALLVIQKGRLIQKISDELRKHILELGTEGTIIKARLKELLIGVEKETNLVIKDYTKLDLKKSRVLLESLSYDEILDSENIMHVLAQESSTNNNIKGWRVLSKTSLAEQEIAKLVKQTGSLGKAIHSNVKEYENAIGSDRAKTFKSEIERIKLNN